MKARWIIAGGVLLVGLGGVFVAHTRAWRPSRADAHAVRVADRTVADGVPADGGPDTADHPAPGRPRTFRPPRLRLRTDSTNATRTRDRELAEMRDAIEASRTARIEAQRLACDELGLDDVTRGAVASIFEQERQAVTSLAGTPDASDDGVHANLIEQRKSRLAALLGHERAEEFSSAYTRHWLDMLSAVYP
ncbi:MAG: hypothetical protein JNK64_15560 [Myxococcales bacterium]|nr:hypothetical protein [Myxococcales bacterium]